MEGGETEPTQRGQGWEPDPTTSGHSGPRMGLTTHRSARRRAQAAADTRAPAWRPLAQTAAASSQAAEFLSCGGCQAALLKWTGINTPLPTRQHLVQTPVVRTPGGAGAPAQGQLLPQDLLLTLLYSVEKPLQLPGPLAVHKPLADAGIQAPGELQKEAQSGRSAHPRLSLGHSRAQARGKHQDPPPASRGLGLVPGTGWCKGAQVQGPESQGVRQCVEEATFEFCSKRGLPGGPWVGEDAAVSGSDTASGCTASVLRTRAV